MGASLSIINNTEDEWRCRISPDESAIKISKLIVGAIATAAAAVSGIGSVVAAGTVLATITTATGVVSSVMVGAKVAVDFADNIVKGVNDNLTGKGYSLIKPGQKHTWSDMGPLLWQQGTCVRSYAVNNRTVQTETLYMRPIFSGAAGENRDHSIAHWINKWGVETSDVSAVDRNN